jgi:hypothetical protein
VTLTRTNLGMLLALLWTAALAACGHAPAVSARMDDALVRSILAAHCSTGSTASQIGAGLDSLGIKPGSRMLYPAAPSRGPVLLVRLFEDRGFWLDSDDADVKWLDISFAFSGDDHLERTLLFRDRLRYVQGEPITSPNSPKRPLARPLEHYPSPIPPPIDPLQGAS